MFASIQFKPELENKKDRKRVLSLMRVQSSAIRFIYKRIREYLWQVLKSALVLPLLEKSSTRDFSPLKSVIIEGKWQRRASRLVPFGFGGT
ncbi:hypothetical protein [Thermocrinis sp.]